ncbi:MAG: type II 3-dehydroquinate dehydratase [Candidatus Azotimanducaceae bacterium]|uniref:3-dehydroquinate dehydratase n=1 Tax=OM182 bacterium TaxID=2510334 RepID=A0A520S3L3_9GAMM|nr:type II 3-dehydroquinate dehydratase [Gammaproteobacteria bacterium]OUV67606.1 MAG: type II 3-dehydroquinate dehydratase [Gammaproteobacteria bacterium TMED133]RZO77072.1 MAG: type II 3-dehydroquinate dehydratase [OM182 bacterium]
MSKIRVIHGPNLNLLGVREPNLYGSENLETINQAMREVIEAAGHEFDAYQSNAEHDLVGKVQSSRLDTSFIIINPGAFTHTSIALRDAFLGVGIPFIEVHLSNIDNREDFRQRSFFSDIAVGSIIGLGSQGYLLAAQAALSRL